MIEFNGLLHIDSCWIKVVGEYWWDWFSILIIIESRCDLFYISFLLVYDLIDCGMYSLILNVLLLFIYYPYMLVSGGANLLTWVTKVLSSCAWGHWFNWWICCYTFMILLKNNGIIILLLMLSETTALVIFCCCA